MSELPEPSVGSSEASPETAGPNAETTLLAENKAVMEKKEAQRDDGTLSIDMENSETEFPSLALMEIVDGKFFVEEFFNDHGAATVSEVDSDDGHDFMTPSEVRSMAMKRIGDLTSSESDSDDSVRSDKWISSYLVSASTMSLTRSICLSMPYDSMTDSTTGKSFMEKLVADNPYGKTPFSFSASHSSDNFECTDERCQLESFPSWSETFEECEESTALEMTEKDYTSEEQQQTESSSEAVSLELMDGECSGSERHIFDSCTNVDVSKKNFHDNNRSNENSFHLDGTPGIDAVSALLLCSKFCVDLLNCGEMQNFEVNNNGRIVRRISFNFTSRLDVIVVYLVQTVHQTKDEDVLGENLFDCSLLDLVDLRKANCSFSQVASVHRPADNLCVRPLQRTDFEKGFLQLLSRLTHVGSVSKGEFCRQFVEMRNCQGTYYVVVIEDLSKSIIVGTCMLVIERKFIHTCGSRARLEDLVVDTAYRGRQLGKLLIEVTRQLAWNLGCYKVSLECKDELISYYEQFGFSKEIGNGNFLVQRQY
ncbi:putative glucosamine 6-phosphate N-acetyltransferase [Trichinella nelsoni]|uniref:glucosamine-phosphate N-acetyltransferase n=1 Tax=Trichinella nelsoni TaxID=6336 RepID=A0A0V0RUF8_9BILA|nr:putative glucosamine 6-phosphate N-acetyltransferase [Trichinella nelsoni]